MSIRDLTVRKFRTEDAKAVAGIIVDNLKEACGQNCEQITPRFVLALSNKKKMYVALVDKMVVGTACIDHDRISAVFVDKDNNGKGASEALLNLLEEIAANNGIQHIKLESNDESQKLYQRLGYQNTDEAVEDELGRFTIMEKYLS